jgi:acetyl esterase/lipase
MKRPGYLRAGTETSCITSLVLLVLIVALSSGCLKKSFEVFGNRAERKNFKAYGPMEDYGARSDYEKLNIAYAPGQPDDEFLTLDVYWNEHEGVQPTVINIHGGAWEVGDKDALNSMFRSKYMANHGYVVFNINYRMLPHYPVKTQVEDVMGAVIWIKEHASEYHADPDRVGVMGGSAGGHLTAMVAWASDDPFFVPTGHEDADYDSDVLAAVPFYGVFDFENMMSEYGERLAPIGYRYFLKEKKGPERDEMLEHISPTCHVGPDLPPIFFVCGDEDSFGLYPDSVNHERMLRQHGVPTGIYTAKGADHGFDTHYGETYTKEAMEATLQWFNRYLLDNTND